MCFVLFYPHFYFFINTNITPDYQKGGTYWNTYDCFTAIIAAVYVAGPVNHKDETLISHVRHYQAASATESRGDVVLPVVKPTVAETARRETEESFICEGMFKESDRKIVTNVPELC